MTFGATLYHILASTSLLFYTAFGYQSLSSLYSTFSMGFMSGEFPGHSGRGIPLHSWNVLVLLELWDGVRSCIKIHPFCWNTMHSHVFIIMNNIPLVFCTSHVTIHFLRRDRPLLIMVLLTCTLNGDYTEV